jgi:hypothetical protein
MNGEFASYLGAATRAIAALYPARRTKISVRDFVALLREQAEEEKLDAETLVSVGLDLLLRACQQGLAWQIAGGRRAALSDRYDLAALAYGFHVIVSGLKERKGYDES